MIHLTWIQQREQPEQKCVCVCLQRSSKSQAFFQKTKKQKKRTPPERRRGSWKTIYFERAQLSLSSPDHRNEWYLKNLGDEICRKPCIYKNGWESVQFAGRRWIIAIHICACMRRLSVRDTPFIIQQTTMGTVTIADHKMSFHVRHYNTMSNVWFLGVKHEMWNLRRALSAVSGLWRLFYKTPVLNASVVESSYLGCFFGVGNYRGLRGWRFVFLWFNYIVNSNYSK